jgi:hypothetical protein
VGRISSHAAEGQYMRELMKKFDSHKQKFSLSSRDTRITLPKPLKDLDIADKVNQGEITIPK